jgi:hypothetical protein
MAWDASSARQDYLLIKKLQEKREPIAKLVLMVRKGLNIKPH